jgi:hypothetical protein
MNILLSKPKRVVAKFHQEHGDMSGWTPEDFSVFQDLLIVAHAKRVRRLRPWMRTKVLLGLVYVLPIYTLAELIYAVSGSYWMPLDRHLDRVDDWCSAAEMACTAAGDTEFVARVALVGERITDAVCRVAGRLAKI